MSSPPSDSDDRSRRNWRPTATFDPWSRMARRVVAGQRQKIRWWRLKRADRATGTETTAIVHRDDLAPIGRSGADGHRYEPSPRGSVRRMVRRLRIDPSDYTFVDLGSGKGAVVLEMAALPFRAVIGVEHSPALHERAVANLAVAHSPRAATRVECVLADAAEWDLPAGPLIIYLCNPFGEQTLGRVLDRLRVACEREDRRVHILVAGRSLGDVMASTPWLARTSTGWTVDM